MIKESLKIFEKYPLTGVGFNAYKFYPSSVGKRVFSDYLQLLVTTGIIGFSAYIWLLLLVAKENLQILNALKIIKNKLFSYSISTGIFAAFIAFIICGTFEPMFFNSRILRLFIFLLGVNKALR
jgi:O-antigen ligase